jgi:hypothetical protein
MSPVTKKKILITSMDGFNVHNPERTARGSTNGPQYVEFSTLDQATGFAEIVREYGWKKSNGLLASFQKILAPAGARSHAMTEDEREAG